MSVFRRRKIESALVTKSPLGCNIVGMTLVRVQSVSLPIMKSGLAEFTDQFLGAGLVVLALVQRESRLRLKIVVAHVTLVPFVSAKKNQMYLSLYQIIKFELVKAVKTLFHSS